MEDGTPDDAGAPEDGLDVAEPDRRVARRDVLRFGTVAAAGGAAAVVSLSHLGRADAATVDPPPPPPPAPPAPTISEAFAGVSVQPRALARWLASPRSVRHIVCVGDSITQGTVGGFDYEHGGGGHWVERLTSACGNAIGPTIGFGYRGLSLGVDAQSNHEWRVTGAWRQTTAADRFDVSPFGEGFRANGGSQATLTWTKPAGVHVAGFELYWFYLAGAGNWQYRIDRGAWINMHQPLPGADNKLHKFYVAKPVHSSVQIRAHNGHAPCLAPIAGIGIYSADPRSSSGLVVHNFGRDLKLLAQFVRNSAGDPLAWLDAVVSNPASLVNRPDLVIAMFSNDVEFNDTSLWQSDLVKLITRVQPYADVLLVSPYERHEQNATVQAAYRAVTKAVAAAYRCGLLDLYDAYAASGAVGWAGANAAGLMLDDSHPSQEGHVDISARVWRLLRTFS